MYTSYFSKYAKLIDEFGSNVVDRFGYPTSIALKTPDWFIKKCKSAGVRLTGYKPLFPPYSLIKGFKETGDEAAYIDKYFSCVLDRLDPVLVWGKLANRTLLCWESTGKFCHRHIVADWLEAANNTNIFEIQ